MLGDAHTVRAPSIYHCAFVDDKNKAQYILYQEKVKKSFLMPLSHLIGYHVYVIEDKHTLFFKLQNE